MVSFAGVSWRAKHWANWLDVKTVLPSCFLHIHVVGKSVFLIENFRLKTSRLLLETSMKPLLFCITTEHHKHVICCCGSYNFHVWLWFWNCLLFGTILIVFVIAGFSEWEDESILAAVLAESQKEYLENLRKGAAKDKSSDEDSKS